MLSRVMLSKKAEQIDSVLEKLGTIEEGKSAAQLSARLLKRLWLEEKSKRSEGERNILRKAGRKEREGCTPSKNNSMVS